MASRGGATIVEDDSAPVSGEGGGRTAMVCGRTTLHERVNIKSFDALSQFGSKFDPDVNYHLRPR